jgi:hypothetical protein
MLSDKVGLSWGQLIDVAHRRPPGTVLIVCDATIEALGQRVVGLVNEQHEMTGDLLVATAPRRDQEALVNEIAARRAELVLDLIAAPAGAGDNQVMIWTVHEALWPGDAQRRGDDITLRYKTHQFQNLALGSLLRSQIGQTFPEGRPSYELAPLFELRRTNAPCAAVMVAPRMLIAQDGTPRERLARGLAAALRDYHRGMAGVQF